MIQAAGASPPVTAAQPTRTGRAPDDDVLRGVPFQRHRVHEHVEEQCPGGQQTGHQVGEQPQPHEPNHPQDHPEDQGVLGAHGIPGQRTTRGTSHDHIDVPIEIVVDGIGSAGRQRAADQRGQHEPGARPAAFGEHHGRHRGDQQQLDDPWFGECDVGTQTGPAAGRWRVRVGDGDLGRRFVAHEHPGYLSATSCQPPATSRRAASPADRQPRTAASYELRAASRSDSGQRTADSEQRTANREQRLMREGASFP